MIRFCDYYDVRNKTCSELEGPSKDDDELSMIVYERSCVVPRSTKSLYNVSGVAVNRYVSSVASLDDVFPSRGPVAYRKYVYALGSRHCHTDFTDFTGFELYSFTMK